MAKEKIKKCSVCGTDIAVNAKTCPSCGAKNKKPITKRAWFWIVVVLAVLGIIGVLGGSGSDSSSDEPIAYTSVLGGSGSDPSSDEPIAYTKVTVAEMNKALEENAAAAAEKYDGQYLEITGELSTIDSDLSYVCLDDPDEWIDLYGVQCYVQSDEQEAVIKTLKSGDTVTIRGKIFDVGEVFGYSMNIDEIVK